MRLDVRTIAELLADHPFSADLDEQTRELIVGCTRLGRFRPGEYLFREGEAADWFLLVRSGRVALEAHAPGRDAYWST
jgi:CRP-like cAMP-binding protein